MDSSGKGVVPSGMQGGPVCRQVGDGGLSADGDLGMVLQVQVGGEGSRGGQGVGPPDGGAFPGRGNPLRIPVGGRQPVVIDAQARPGVLFYEGATCRRIPLVGSSQDSEEGVAAGFLRGEGPQSCPGSAPAHRGSPTRIPIFIQVNVGGGGHIRSHLLLIHDLVPTPGIHLFRKVAIEPRHLGVVVPRPPQEKKTAVIAGTGTVQGIGDGAMAEDESV